MDLLAVEDDLAGLRLEQPRHRAEQGGLAAAVRPDDRRHRTVVHGQVELLDDGVVAVPDVEALGAQTRGVSGGAHAVTFRLRLTRSQIRYGAPIAEVTMPTGSSTGKMTRATRSAATTRIAP